MTTATPEKPSLLIDIKTTSRPEGGRRGLPLEPSYALQTAAVPSQETYQLAPSQGAAGHVRRETTG
jgi:hypothetical protein